MRTQIASSLIAFLKDWAAHGKSLFAAFEIRYDRFIVIGVDEAMAQATGCSIDKLIKTIQAIDSSYGLDLLERMKVAYRDGEDIKEVDANAFAKMLADGQADQDTPVFNNVVESIGELKTSWETTVKESWHRNLLP
ncbi:MAG: ABC transporter ATPase [Flavobacteriales bacterium]|nr:ABC transporter ATPase [Flavobacteriales bacterium]